MLRFFGAQQDAGLRPARGAERGKEAHVLIRLVEDQPVSALRRSTNDLAVLRAPLRLSERAPPGEAGLAERGVRNEDVGNGGERRRQRRRARKSAQPMDSGIHRRAGPCQAAPWTAEIGVY